jgi:hypothetical protein
LNAKEEEVKKPRKISSRWRVNGRSGMQAVD